MFDGLFLAKIKDELKPLITGRITKITSSLETEYVFTIRANRSNYKLLVSLSSSFSRIHLTNFDQPESIKKNFSHNNFQELKFSHIAASIKKVSSRESFSGFTGLLN